MKKIIIAIAFLFVILLTGCEKKIENNEILENEKQEREEVQDVISKEKEEGGDDYPYLSYELNSVSSLENEEKYSEFVSDVISDSYNALFDDSVELLNLLRNMPFALRGHDFSDKDLKRFFTSKDWYHPVNGKQVSISELSVDEQKVIQIIDNKIAEIKYVEDQIPVYSFDSNKEIVYTFFQRERNEYPYVNINSQTIEQLNQEIYDYACANETSDSASYRTSYQYYINNGIVSLLFMIQSAYGGDYGTYVNIDIETGKYIKNSDVLIKNNISIDKISNLKDNIVNLLLTGVGHDDSYTVEEYFNKINKEEYVNLYHEFIASFDDVDKFKLVYFDNEGKCHAIVELVVLAGQAGNPALYDCILNIE